MGELSSIWLYQEEDAEDLKQKLQSTRMELEEVRLEVSVAKEETREKERQLHNLLQMACRERDEAREQLRNLLNRINNPTPSLMMVPTNNSNLPNSDDTNAFLKQQQLQFPRANSSITESNTLSDTFNNLNNSNNSYVSSPVDSMFDAVTSPEFSTLNNMGESGNNVGFVNTFVHDMRSHTGSIMSSSANRFDHVTAVIDELAKGKVLPQKGKLLDAVMEAGPLLQTLMLVGPLPSWRNPPLQHFKIPLVAAAPFAEMSCSSSSHHMGNNSMLNFSNGDLRWVSPAMNMNNQIAVGKRQRLM